MNVQEGRQRRRQRLQIREAAAAEAAAGLSAQRTRFQRALGADTSPEPAELDEAGDDELGYAGGALNVPAAPASSGAGDADPWGPYLGSRALDEDAQRDWRAFVEKSKAAAVRPAARGGTRPSQRSFCETLAADICLSNGA